MNYGKQFYIIAESPIAYAAVGARRGDLSHCGAIGSVICARARGVFGVANRTDLLRRYPPF